MDEARTQLQEVKQRFIINNINKQKLPRRGKAGWTRLDKAEQGRTGQDTRHITNGDES